MKKKILLDIDGVIANFYPCFAKFLNKNYCCSLDPNLEPNYYDFALWGGGIDLVNLKKAVIKWYAEKEANKIEPFSGAIKFVKKIQNKYDVYIVTARVDEWKTGVPDSLIDSVKKETELWLRGHGISTKKLFFSKNKTEFCIKNNIKIMIEDRRDTVKEAAGRGISSILIARNYNAGCKLKDVFRTESYEKAIKHIDKI